MDRNNVKRQYWHGEEDDADTTGCQCSLSGGDCTADPFGRKVLTETSIFLGGPEFFHKLHIFQKDVSIRLKIADAY